MKIYCAEIVFLSTMAPIVTYDISEEKRNDWLARMAVAFAPSNKSDQVAIRKWEYGE